MNDRRSFLKRLGLGAAIVPNTLEGADRSAAAEVVHAREFERPDVETGELISSWLYSGLVIPKNSMRDSYSFFCDSLGAAAPHGGQVGLDLTNMLRSGQLPPPEVFAISRVGVFVSPATQCQLWGVFAERSVLEIQVENKVYFQGPVASLFGTERPHGDLYTVSAEHLRGAITLPLPVVIPTYGSFRAMLYVREPLRVHAKIKMWVYLAGRSSRSVQ